MTDIYMRFEGCRKESHYSPVAAEINHGGFWDPPRSYPRLSEQARIQTQEWNPWNGALSFCLF